MKLLTEYLAHRELQRRTQPHAAKLAAELRRRILIRELSALQKQERGSK